MRRLWSLVLSVILAAALGGEALAASAEMIRAFVQGDVLYAYVDLTGNESPITKAEASIGGQVFSSSGNLETVRQAGSPVTYLLLLDASTSMPGYQEEIVAYAGALSQTAGEHTRFLLATFGAEFALVEEDLAPEELSGAVEAVAYTETSSRLLEGISAALDYLEGLPRSGNELRNIVVLSDAVEYDADGSVPYDGLLERLTASDAILHSVGFGGDKTPLGSLAALAEASGGRHWAAGAEHTAAAAAEELSEMNGRLYVTSFSLSGYSGGTGRQEVSVTFAAGAELACRAQAEVTIPEDGILPGGEPVREEPDRVLPPSGQGSQTPASPAPAQEDDKPALGAATLEILAGAGFLVILAVVLLIVLVRRRRRRQQEGGSPAAPQQPQVPPVPPSGQGIYVRLEILRGTYLGQSQEFTLETELVIGRDSACDMVFDDPAISRRHVRVFLAGGVVYLEDLGSQNGTFLNGARVEMASILRSGDEIALGDTALRLKF